MSSSSFSRHGSIGSGQQKLIKRTYSTDETEVDTLTEIWRCNTADYATLRPYKDDPSSTEPNLLLKRCTAETIGGGLIEYTAVYSGFSAGAVNVSTAVPFYRLLDAQRTEPLNNHPNWETNPNNAFPASMRIALGDAAYFASYQENQFIGVSGLARSATGNGNTTIAGWAQQLQGVDSYFDTGAVWQQIKLEASPPDMSDALKRWTTAQLPGPISSATVPAGRNWLLMIPTGEQEGTIWRNTYSWLLSGRNGWNPLIYLAKT